MVLFFFLACPLRISAAIQLDSRSDLQRLVIALAAWVMRQQDDIRLLVQLSTYLRIAATFENH